MRYDYIDEPAALLNFCKDIAGAASVAFDTEFIAEDSYRPQLCLLQVAAGGRLAVIDPLAVTDLRPFWELLAKPGCSTIVHAGREEFRFCMAAVQQRPHDWFDVQLAAAFVGLEYPAAYSTLIYKLIGESLPKGETRTDWRRRPLSQNQIEYALADVRYLEPMRDILQQQLRSMGRESWFQEDTVKWQDQIEHQDQQETWQRVSGISNLSSRSLAIVRELWRWRDAEAKRRDCPPRRVLRDDLIVELARRKTADPKRIRAVRGLERTKRHMPQISDAIQRAIDLPDHECPRPPRKAQSNSSQFGLLGQFLNSSLGVICRSVHLAPTLVGTVQDVRDLIAYHLQVPGADTHEPPALARGWRAEVVGRVIEDLMEGRLVMRVADPRAAEPLVFEPPATGQEKERAGGWGTSGPS